MQGFNRYIPPDFNPKETSSLNAHQGKKHALGKRAKDIDKGILIVRFELPFNIWCGTCNAHIGAGVRYNAQKKKVGNYFSTPIYGFRCKCHLCSGWFEIRTDPKNAAYEVYEGARKKDETWDPVAEGSYAPHDTEAPSAAEAPTDPFAHIEKTIDQQTWAKTKTARLTELQESADRLSSDPYVVSAALRRRFREEKRVMLEKQGRDDALKERFGLGKEVELGEEGVELSREMWEAGRERRGLAVEPREAGGDEGGLSSRGVVGTPGVGPSTPGSRAGGGASRATAPVDLGKSLRRSTAKKYDPFGDAMDELFASGSKVKLRGKIKDPASMEGMTNGIKAKGTAEAAASATPTTALATAVPAVQGVAAGLGLGGLGGGLLAGYASD